MRKLIVSILAILIILSCFLSGCQFGSYVIGGEYYSSPKEAFNSEATLDPVTGLSPNVSSVIDIYPINSDYSICLVMIDYTRNGEFVRSDPTALLMKTQGQKYYYMGSSESVIFEIVDKLVFEADGVEYEFYIGKEEFFKEIELDEKNFHFYETMIDIDGGKQNFKIAIGNGENIA